MGSRRVKRAEDLIRREISSLLLFKSKDPRFKSLSITSVRMTPDLRRATISYSLFDDNLSREEVRDLLEKAKGFFRREVGRAVALKYVPELVFEYDQSLEYAQHMDQVISGLKVEPLENGDEPG